ncbi:MAG: hypothetical protein AAB365_03585 [Patescibacteria group bacterium]
MSEEKERFIVEGPAAATPLGGTPPATKGKLSKLVDTPAKKMGLPVMIIILVVIVWYGRPAVEGAWSKVMRWAASVSTHSEPRQNTIAISAYGWTRIDRPNGYNLHISSTTGTKRIVRVNGDPTTEQEATDTMRLPKGTKFLETKVASDQDAISDRLEITYVPIK